MLDEEMMCRIIDRFCVVCIRNEWISWLREQKRMADREVNMESAATKYTELSRERFKFCVKSKN